MLTTEHYTEGMCGDGAVILCDGVPMSVSEILATLQAADNRTAQPVAWLAIYHGEVYDEAIGITRSVVEAQADRFGWESALTEIIPLYRHTPPAPASARSAAWEMRFRNSGHNMWGDWERITAEQHAEMSVQHATDNDYEFRVLYAAPTAPVVAEVRR